MRAQTDMEQKIAIALAIYRGLPDSERAERLSEWRQLSGYDARTLVTLCEQHEMSVRLEKGRLSDLEKEVRFVRAQLASRTEAQPDIYGHERADIRRGAFGVVALFAGVAGAYWLFVQVGPVVVFSGVAIALLLRAMFAGKGDQEGDYTTTAGQSNAGQSININITGHGGQINFQQGQGQA